MHNLKSTKRYPLECVRLGNDFNLSSIIAVLEFLKNAILSLSAVLLHFSMNSASIISTSGLWFSSSLENFDSGKNFYHQIINFNKYSNSMNIKFYHYYYLVV